jgi:hypothetical protein
MTFVWGWPDVFAMIRHGITSFWKDSHRKRCPSHHIISESTMTSMWLIARKVNFDHLRLCLPGFSTGPVAVLCFPCSILWKWVTKSILHLREGKLSAHPDGKIAIYSIWNSGRIVSSHLFIYSIICCYQFGHTDTYFILWAITQYYHYYFVAIYIF